MHAVFRWIAVAFPVAGCWASLSAAADPEPYRSPSTIAVSADGGTVYVSDATAGSLHICDPEGRTVRGQVALSGRPQGICLAPDGRTLYVAERGAGTVAVIDTGRAAVSGRITVARWPVDVALAPQAGRLLVCNQDAHTVSVVDLRTSPPTVIREIPVVREPVSVAVTPDERFAVVANQIPLGPSTDPALAADVSIIDLQQLAPTATVKLPPGSTAVNGVCTSPNGAWAYAIHSVGHFNLPMTQLERGWVNTYALTIIDIPKGRRLATLLLDDITQGAADPHDILCSPDGSRLFVSHAGVHEIGMIEIARVHELLAGKIPGDLADLKDGSLPNVWVRIQQDPKLIEELTYDLTALYLAGAIRRVPAGGKGPRGLALSADGKSLFVANYFSGTIAQIDAASGKLTGTIPLGGRAEMDPVRRGELLFHDATASFQRWHSCATCHPNDGRLDGLRWDFADDGLGNAMNTPTVLYPHETEPLHREGTLANTRVLAEHGLMFTHLVVPNKEQIDDLVEYMKSLRADPSPHLTAAGQRTAAAERGKAVFEGRAECAKCHKGPRFTDREMYQVGVVTPNYPDAKYKTTPLVELYRSAPYLHDGRAVTLRDVLTTHNARDEHGKTTKLSDQELDDLVAYLLSL